MGEGPTGQDGQGYQSHSVAAHYRVFRLSYYSANSKVNWSLGATLPRALVVTVLRNQANPCQGGAIMDRKSPLSDSKFKQWLELFRAARRETDETKRRGRIEAAQKAIHERARELAQEGNESRGSMEERWLIDVALMNLRSLLQREAA